MTIARKAWIMTKRKNSQNARQRYYQTVLTGCGHLFEPKNTDSDSNAREQTPAEEREAWEQKSYKLAIEIIVSEVSISDSEYSYNIQINANPDIPVIPISGSGKGLPKQAFTIRGKKGGRKTKLPMVYGIPKAGTGSFSRTSGNTPVHDITRLHSAILEQIDRAIERRVQFITDQKTGDDPGSSLQGTLPQKDLGEDTQGGRGKAIRAKVLPKDTPKEDTGLDDTIR